MGGRLSFLRRKRAKQAAAAVPDEAPPVVEEPPPPPPPEVFDSATFWEALKGILRFRRGDYSTPVDKSTLHVHDATKISDEELEDVKDVSKALGDRFLAINDPSMLPLNQQDAAMEHFTYALSLLALGNTTAACNELVNAIAKDPTFGRAYTHLAHTLLLDTQDDTATLERVVGYLECALKYDDTEVRENTILLAEVYSLLGNHAGALDVYSHLTHVEQEWENVFHMARCEWALGHFDKSIVLLETLRLDPCDATDPSMANKRLVLADAQSLLLRHPCAVVAAT